MKKKLHLSSHNKIIAGVCGGLGEYFNADPTIVRIIFALLTLIFNITPVIIYVICWAIMPNDETST